MAVVAEDDIGVSATVDPVGALAAEQAVAAFVALNVVVGAIGSLDGTHVVNLGRAQQLDARRRHVHSDVRPVGLVHAADVHAQDRTAATDAGDGVQAARRGRQVLVDDAVVAEDDVVTGVAAQRVGPRDERVAHRRRHHERHGVAGHHQQRAGDRVDVETGVTVNVVVALLAGDGVVAGAACKVVSQLAAADRVVARAAVDRQANARRTDDVGGRQRAGIDDIVAREVERVGQAEAEGIVGRADRVAELRAEDGHVGPGLVQRAAGAGGVARIPQAVLRAVAIDHQR